jgi:membrane peptidoglycan carboxypeptidase
VKRGATSSSGRSTYVPKHAPKPRATEGASSAAPGGGPTSTKGPGQTGPKKRSFLRRRWWLFVLVVPAVLFASVAVGLFVAYARLQLPETLPPIQTTYLYERNGDLLTTLHGAVNRTEVPLSEISPNMIDAVIATEDHDFYNHPGVDVMGIARAAYTDLIKRGTVQGASTITEQLVKNVYAGSYTTDKDGVQVYTLPERSIREKIREALLAVKLEQELGKDEILDRYLNTVYFGHGAYGIQAAARTYFGVDASKLTVLQSASLAGVLHAPELYDPIDRPSDNWFRRNYAIDQMVRYGYLPQKKGERLKKVDCCGTIKDRSERLYAPGQSEYFAEYVRQQLFDRYGEAQVYAGGLQVTTTLDLGLQQAAEQAIATELPHPKDDPAAALVAMDPRTGEILAMAGGRNWDKNKFNYATMRGGSGRQSGSAFKAFTLATAMQQGYDLHAYWKGPATLGIPDCPDSTQPDGIWHPVNAGDGEAGTFTLAGATVHSVNTVFAQLIAQLGPSSVADMARKLGIRSDLPDVCAITLGSVGVNPLEMTNAYATIADQGERHWATPLLQVKLGDGSVDPSVVSPGERELDPNDANLVTYALQGVVREGTGTSAQLSGFPVAGKTGTANENVDAWFCGYTVQIVTCAWVGWPEGEIPLQNVEGVPSVYGGTIPAAIWHDFMSVAMQGLTPEQFPVPSFDGYTLGPAVSVASPTPSPLVTATPSPKQTRSPSPKPSESPSPSPTTSPSTTASPTSSPSAPGAAPP